MMQRRAAHFMRPEQLNHLDPVGAFEQDYESAWIQEFDQRAAGGAVIPHHGALINQQDTPFF